MLAPVFHLSLIPTQDLRVISLYFWKPPLLPLRFWSCLLTWSVTMPTCIHMYRTIQNVSLCWIKHQSQFVTQVPVIYHLGNILIALWCKRYAREIRFTVKLQFCQKLHGDHQCSPPLSEYFVILLDFLTIRPWNVSGTICTDLFLSFCIFRHF